MSSPPSFDEFAKDYAESFRGLAGIPGKKWHDYVTRWRADYLNRIAQEKLGNLTSIKALDIGCGIGLSHAYLSSLGQLSGVDVSAVSLGIAQKQFPQFAYQPYDGKHLPYSDGAFDVTMAVCVLHHVEPSERMSFLSEMSRVTRSGGLTVLVEHNPFNIVSQWIVARCEFDVGVKLVYPRKLKSLWEKTSMCDVRVDFLWYATPALLNQRMEKLLRRIPLGLQYSTVATKA
ncbi:MAG: class I SAM-dependent methyltransferase [Deltaproteobacteria bacterium]|nr:class I SAM-dependent methyltransferase [Deltaproteobacteria bacterium]